MADREPLVDVVIANWNGWERLERCLAALARQTLRDLVIWVVDNGSQDGSPARIEAGYPQVRLLCNPRNLGFAVASNQGIRAGRAPYVATLNNDAEPEACWLAALVEAIAGDGTVGMAASRMVLHDRPSQIDSAGIAIDRAGLFWDRLGGSPDGGPASKRCQVFGPCAGAALYRRAMLDDVGLFADHFFCYLEDVDLAWRARLAGWQALYVPEARVTHIHSGSLGDISPLKSYLLGRNKLWAIIRNYPQPYLARRWPLIVGYDLLAAAYAVVAQGRLGALQGRIAAWRGLGRAWRERAEIQKRMRVTPAEADRWMEPAEAPWHALRRFVHRSPTNDIRVP